MAVGAIEPKFYAQLLFGLELDDVDPPLQYDRGTWLRTRERIAAAFRKRTRSEWTEVFENTDACVSPVLSMLEAGAHPHLQARGTVVTQGGMIQAAPAPRFSGTPPLPGAMPAAPGERTVQVMTEWGVGHDLIAECAVLEKDS
jgi:alpha-methylacyl-CoA racemase